MADLWTDLRRQSVAWQTRPRTVWSDHGGRRREITVEWPRGERGMWRYEARRGLGVLVYFAVLGLLSVLAVELLEESVTGVAPDDRGDDPAHGLLLLTAFIALSLTATVLALVVRFVRDVRGRRRPDVVQGAVVLREDVAILSDGNTIHRYYMAVDDGTADTVTAVQVQPAHHAHFKLGDVVRLVRAGGTGSLVRIEGVHDAEGRPVPPLGTMPAVPPEAGVTTGEVAQAIGRVVRGLEVTTSGDGDGGEPVQTWTFHLVGGSTYVKVHLSSGGERGAEAIVALADPEDRAPRSVAGLGDRADRYRLPSLLVARRGATVVGIQVSAFVTPPHTWWDEQLARKALSRLTTSSRR